MKLQPTLTTDGRLLMGYTTPCCGTFHFLFPDETPTCYSCGRDLSAEPQHTQAERNLDHLRFQAVSRYVS